MVNRINKPADTPRQSAPPRASGLASKATNNKIVSQRKNIPTHAPSRNLNGQSGI
jgi:hypothetical protein